MKSKTNYTLSRKRRLLLVGWFMVLPAVCLRAFTTVYPTLATFAFSLFDYGKLNNSMEFIGMANFVRLFRDPKILASIRFTLLFSISSVVLQVLAGVGLALLLNYKFPARRYIRTVALIPWAMPMIVAGIAASWAFNDMYGLVNDLIRRFASDFHFDWLVSKTGAQVAVILVDVWKSAPFFAIMILASLQSISEDMYESARIDGAGTFRIFFSITLPGISRILLTMVILTSLWRLSSFDVVYSMTKGGPGNTTSLLAYRIFTEAFRSLNLGYASAINVVLFLLMAAFGLTGLALQRRLD